MPGCAAARPDRKSIRVTRPRGMAQGSSEASDRATHSGAGQGRVPGGCLTASVGIPAEEKSRRLVKALRRAPATASAPGSSWPVRNVRDISCPVNTTSDRLRMAINRACTWPDHTRHGSSGRCPGTGMVLRPRQSVRDARRIRTCRPLAHSSSTGTSRTACELPTTAIVERGDVRSPNQQYAGSGVAVALVWQRARIGGRSAGAKSTTDCAGSANRPRQPFSTMAAAPKHDVRPWNSARTMSATWSLARSYSARTTVVASTSAAAPAVARPTDAQRRARQAGPDLTGSSTYRLVSQASTSVATTMPASRGRRAVRAAPTAAR